MLKITMKQYESMLVSNPKLAKQIYDSGLVSEGRKAHYSEDMKQCEKLVNPTITDKNGKYKSYTNKNGVTYECRFYFRKMDK